MDTLRQKLKVNKDAQAFLQAELALRISSHNSNICKYEPDEVKPPIDMVEKIADVLDVSIDYLIGKTKMVLDKEAIEKLEDISKLNEDKTNYVFNLIDMCLRDFKMRKSFAK